MFFKKVTFFVFLITLIGSVTSMKKRDFVCSENSKACNKNSGCCSGCCFRGQCVSNLNYCTGYVDPCSQYECPPPTMCYLQTVYCIRAPCPPIATCKQPMGL